MKAQKVKADANYSVNYAGLVFDDDNEDDVLIWRWGDPISRSDGEDDAKATDESESMLGGSGNNSKTSSKSKP